MALNAWCDARPQFTGAFSGVCRIHRAELLQLGGAWPDASTRGALGLRATDPGLRRGDGRAGVLPAGRGPPVARASPHAAEEAFRYASEYGWETQPGLALLWLAQGKVDACVAAIRRALAETTDRLARSRLLPAYVEIMLATEDVSAARDGARELAEIAEAYDTAALHARSAHARGAVHLADGSPEAALPALRLAWRLWRDLDAPHEAACARVLIAVACRALRDEDTAAMELDAARQVFAQLGAVPDLTRIDALIGKRRVGDAAGLSAREVEVLRLVAAGKTNQAIAAELLISDRTVARHLGNIFAKLGVGSRTAAAAYAFGHGIR